MSEITIMVLVLNGVILLMMFFILIKISGLRKEDTKAQFAILERNIDRLERGFKDEFGKNRSEFSFSSKALREEVSNSLKGFTDSIGKQMLGNSQLQVSQNELLVKQLQALTTSNEERMDKMREGIEGQLKAIQEDNSKKLEEMRKTVDEKLHETLEKRLGESFKLVSDRLEQVHKGLGEMQTLASGVGDLKRVLTNVKTRGTWGEIQLGNLLEQVLTSDQYAQNVATIPGSNERVECAIKLPGRDKEGTIVWLPIDAKFPQEDYQRLLEAQEQANAVLVEEAGKALENRVKGEAKDIAAKYISVPYTTEFGILFLPTEGLYAEVLRRPGLFDVLLQEYKVIISGPTTLAALLSSLQMGFRTLAIERRSSEVWSLLGAVKTEFGKFGDLLDKTGKKLQEAGNTIDNASRRSRAIEKKLKDVQELPQIEVCDFLGSIVEEEME